MADKANYNGIEFNYLDTGDSGQMKQSVHDFNDADPQVQQHGKAPKTIKLEAIFLGANSVEQSNVLIAEIERTNGKGILTHPELGEIEVAISNYPRTIVERQNKTTISLEFIRSGVHQTISKDKLSGLVDAISTINDLSKNTLIKNITADNNATNTLNTISNATGSTLNKATLATDVDNLVANFKTISIPSNNAIAAQFIAEQNATHISTARMHNTYTNLDGLATALKEVGTHYLRPEITESANSNHFRNLQLLTQVYINNNNQNLPRLKTTTTNIPIPQDLAKHKLGDTVVQFNTPEHPLFPSTSVKHIEEQV